MDTFELVRRWLAKSLEISEKSITRQSTLGDLIPPGRRTDSGAIEGTLVLELARGLPGVNGELLTQNMTVQGIVDRTKKWEQESDADRFRRRFIEVNKVPALERTVRVFGYLPELDAFQITEEFQRLASYLGLVEWHAAVWIGRLFMLDNDYGEHWFDNWDEREAVTEKAREMGIDPYSLMIFTPDRFADGRDGPCHPPELRKRFWTDVLKSLELSYELLFEEARSQNADAKEMRERYQFEGDYIEDLEERIQRIREGQEPPLLQGE